MKTLLMLTAGMLVAAAAVAAPAADESTIPTITVTAKRHMSASAELVPPQADVEITVLMPTDMPEAEIDYHLSPIGVSPTPAVE